MNNEYNKTIGINDECFDNMRSDADVILQKLIKDMIEKKSQNGTMTIKIDVTLYDEFINDYDEYGNPYGGHDATKPLFEHKISSVMQIKNDTKGQSYSQYLELQFDEDSKKYILVPIKGSQQMSLFDMQDDDDLIEDKDIKPLPFSPEAYDMAMEDNEDDNEDNEFAAFDQEFASSMNPPEEYEYDEPEEFLEEDEIV